MSRVVTPRVEEPLINGEDWWSPSVAQAATTILAAIILWLLMWAWGKFMDWAGSYVCFKRSTGAAAWYHNLSWYALHMDPRFVASISTITLAVDSTLILLSADSKTGHNTSLKEVASGSPVRHRTPLKQVGDLPNGTSSFMPTAKSTEEKVIDPFDKRE